jgi:hypothetical protein
MIGCECGVLLPTSRMAPGPGSRNSGMEFVIAPLPRLSFRPMAVAE